MRVLALFAVDGIRQYRETFGAQAGDDQALLRSQVAAFVAAHGRRTGSGEARLVPWAG